MLDPHQRYNWQILFLFSSTLCGSPRFLLVFFEGIKKHFLILMNFNYDFVVVDYVLVPYMSIN